MIVRNRATAVDPLYGRRARASVLTPVHCLTDRFCPLTESPSISCSVFTLSDPSLNGQSFHLKNQLLWRFKSALPGKSTHFAGLEWLAWILGRTDLTGISTQKGLWLNEKQWRCINLIRRKISLGFLSNRAKKRAVFCLAMGLMLYPFIVGAQEKAYPHLQIFLLSSGPASRIAFITFWDGSHKLAAGPFPIKLLEREGLSVLLDLSYSKPNEERPSAARLKIQRRDSASLQDREGLVLDQPADFIADRGVSKMFPNGPFLVVGHKAYSEGVLQVGTMMGEIQGRLLACDKDYRRELEMALKALKGMSSYDHVSRAIESTFAPCPRQRP